MEVEGGERLFYDLVENGAPGLKDSDASKITWWYQLESVRPLLHELVEALSQDGTVLSENEVEMFRKLKKDGKVKHGMELELKLKDRLKSDPSMCELFGQEDKWNDDGDLHNEIEYLESQIKLENNRNSSLNTAYQTLCELNHVNAEINDDMSNPESFKSESQSEESLKQVVSSLESVGSTLDFLKVQYNQLEDLSRFTESEKIKLLHLYRRSNGSIESKCTPNSQNSMLDQYFSLSQKRLSAEIELARSKERLRVLKSEVLLLSPSENSQDSATTATERENINVQSLELLNQIESHRSRIQAELDSKVLPMVLESSQLEYIVSHDLPKLELQLQEQQAEVEQLRSTFSAVLQQKEHLETVSSYVLSHLKSIVEYRGLSRFACNEMSECIRQSQSEMKCDSESIELEMIEEIETLNLVDNQTRIESQTKQKSMNDQIQKFMDQQLLQLIDDEIGKIELIRKKLLSRSTVSSYSVARQLKDLEQEFNLKLSQQLDQLIKTKRKVAESKTHTSWIDFYINLHDSKEIDSQNRSTSKSRAQLLS